MATYAMICNDTVIDILYNQSKEPCWPPDPIGNPVVAIPCSDAATGNWLYNPETQEVFEPIYVEPELPKEPEGITNEYEQYYNVVNTALTGGV